MANVWLVFELCSYLIYIIIIPIGIYLILKAYPKHNEMFINKRSKSVFYGLNFSFIYAIFGCFIAELATMQCLSHKIIWITAIVLFFSSIWVLIFFLISKNWMIFYKYKWTHYTLQSKWQNMINPTTITNDDTHWFINNNKTYGNINYIYKLFGLLCFIGFIFNIIPLIPFVLTDFSLLSAVIFCGIVASSMSPPIVLYIVIVRKTPSFDDTFYIHLESKIHAKLLTLLVIVNGIMNVAFIMTGGDFTTCIFGMPAMSIILFVMTYYSTVIITKKNMNNTTAIYQNVNINITLDMILSNKDAIHLFMVYLSENEYSMECLLSYIEISQYQKYLYQHINDNDQDEDIKNVKLFNFPSNIPISSIINVDMDNNKELLEIAKIRAHKLHNKYTKTGSEFEINISFIQRQRIIEVLEDLHKLLNQNVNLTDLFLIFEDSKQEMITLLTSSFNRFRYEVEFAKITAIFDQNKMKT